MNKALLLRTQTCSNCRLQGVKTKHFTSKRDDRGTERESMQRVLMTCCRFESIWFPTDGRERLGCYGLCVQSVTVRSAEDERKDRSCVCHRHWITLSPCSPTTVWGSGLVRSPAHRDPTGLVFLLTGEVKQKIKKPVDQEGRFTSGWTYLGGW